MFKQIILLSNGKFAIRKLIPFGWTYWGGGAQWWCSFPENKIHFNSASDARKEWREYQQYMKNKNLEKQIKKWEWL